MEDAVSQRKKQLRKEMLRTLMTLPDQYKLDADSRITENLRSLPEYQQADTVFCFVGTEHEICTRPFLQGVLDQGKRLAVPLCIGKGIMEARQIYALDELTCGFYGLYQPDSQAPVIPMEEIQFAVIPCLTADRRGNRLGHGGGYYDRLFNQYPDVLAAIICRERILREEIPLEVHDHRFPITISEEQIYRED